MRLSVPTRFLKSWIQSHYAERVLACWQADETDVRRIELTGALGGTRTSAVKPRPETETVDGSASRNVNGAAHRADDVSATPTCTRRSAARRSIRG